MFKSTYFEEHLWKTASKRSYFGVFISNSEYIPQPIFTCSMSTIGILEKVVKYALKFKNIETRTMIMTWYWCLPCY